MILNFTNSYVLFAANLDDFRSIAKKFIPDKLADQLTNMAAQNSMKYRQQKQANVKVDDTTDEYSYETEAPKPAVREIKTTPKKRFAIKDQKHDIDFDELVDRVREQLEHKFKDKDTRGSQDYYDESDANKELESKQIDHTKAQDSEEINNKITKTTPITYTTENTQMQYDDGTGAEPLAEDDGMFKGADLTKTNDSYEDYVIPDKDKTYESEEKKTTKHQRVHSEKESIFKQQRLQSVNTVKSKEAEEDQEYTEHKSEEVKAKTESLTEEPEQKAPGKPNKLKGTMIPTREYYKMSSPNYYGRIKAVAEKYDFNEPLPEKDREPEDLKYFVNPPASINKKVKLTSNL